MNDNTYNQIVDRLVADGYIETKQEVKPSLYFKEAIQHILYRYDNLMPKYHYGWGTAWEHVRRLVIWSYGVRLVSQMRLEDREEANKLAIKLIDDIFVSMQEESI